MSYWATIITSPDMKALPAIVNIGTCNEEDAQGYMEMPVLQVNIIRHYWVLASMPMAEII